MLSDPSVTILMYFVLPVWFIAGFADWICHRATSIETASGVKELAIHALMWALGECVRTSNLTNGKLRCRLQWHNNEITFLDCIAELVELCSEVQLRLVFLIWQSLLNDPEYRVTVLGGSEIANIETENKLTLIKGVRLLFAMPTETD